MTVFFNVIVCFCSFLGEDLKGSLLSVSVLLASAAPTLLSIIFWGLAHYAYSHGNFYSYVIFHYIKIPHSVHSTVNGLWEPFQFIIITKNAAIHVVPLSLCAHIQESQ